MAKKSTKATKASKTSKEAKPATKKKSTKATKSKETPPESEEPLKETIEESAPKPKARKKISTKSAEPESQPQPVIKEVITIGEDLEEEENLPDVPFANKWWLEEPYRTLLDPDLAKNVNFAKYDLSSLIEDFTEKMLEEDLIDFRISGLALYSSAKLYHQKISGVIREEEEIQKKEAKERLRREVPNALSQPLRESRKIATQDDLFGAMRRAILETMQNREKLRIRRERKVAKQEQQVKTKSKGKLPAEILKHISGSEETIEERLQKRHRQIQEIIRLESSKDETMSMEYLKNMIYSSDKLDQFGKKVEYIRVFEEMLFLASLSKVVLRQQTMRSPIDVKLVDKTKIEF